MGEKQGVSITKWQQGEGLGTGRGGDSSMVTSFLAQHIPYAQKGTQILDLLTLRLPYQSSNSFTPRRLLELAQHISEYSLCIRER